MDGREEFLAHLKAKGQVPATINYRAYFLDFFFSFLSRRDIHDVREATPQDLDAFWTETRQAVNHYTRKPLSPRTVQERLSVVKNYLAFLLKQRRLLVDPARHLTPLMKGKSLPRNILTEGEMARLLEAPDVREAVGLRDRAAMEVLYSTGVRGPELLRLNLGDIDFAERILTVRQGKGKKDRVVPVGKTALTWVDHYLREVRQKLPCHDGALFADLQYKRRLNWSALMQRLRIHVRAADLSKRVTLYTFRHSFATHLLRGGASLRAVQEMLGHSNMRTTQIYARVVPVDLKAAHRRHHPRARLPRHSL